MFHRIRVIAFIIVLVAIGGAVAWYLQVNHTGTASQVSGDQAIRPILSSADYQQRVSSVLSRVSAAPADSLPAAITAAQTELQTLVVNDDVKYDHLALFMAFDLWARKTPNYNELVRSKLAAFAQHQTWSAASVQAVISKLPTS